MKAIQVLFLLNLLLSGHICSQIKVAPMSEKYTFPLTEIGALENNDWLLDTMITTFGGEITGEKKYGHYMMTFIYNDNGKVTQYTQRRIVNSDSIFSLNDKATGDWEDVHMTRFFWNKQKINQADSSIQYKKFDGLNWEVEVKMILERDDRGNMTTITSLVAEKAVGMYSNQFIYTYDNNNNCLSYITTYLINNEWVPSSRRYYTYDKHNNLLKEEEYEGLNESISSGRAYTYDDKNNLLKDSIYAIDFHQKTTYTYGDNGNLLTTSVTESDNPSAGWYEVSYEIQSCNENGLRTEYTNYQLNKYTNKLELIDHNTYEYDNSNFIIKVYHHKTDSNIKKSLSEKIYDEEHNILEERTSSWDSDKEDWMPCFRILHTYDEYKNCIEIKCIILTTNNEWIPLSNILYFTYNNGKSESSIDMWRGIFSYTQTGGNTSTTKIEDTSEAIKIFPNPVTDIANISINLKNSQPVTIRIFDLSGKLINQIVDPAQTEGTIVKSINMGHLNKGVYIFHVTIGENTMYQKVLKR